MDSLRLQTALRRKATFYIVGYIFCRFLLWNSSFVRGWETSVFSVLKSLVGGGKFLLAKCSEKYKGIQSVAKTKRLTFRQFFLVTEPLLLRYKKKCCFFSLR